MLQDIELKSHNLLAEKVVTIRQEYEELFMLHCQRFMARRAPAKMENVGSLSLENDVTIICQKPDNVIVKAHNSFQALNAVFQISLRGRMASPNGWAIGTAAEYEEYAQ